MSYVGDEVQILYDGTEDITHHVMYEKAKFTSLMAAVPGTWEMTLKDTARELNFTSGHEIQLFLNGLPAYGGYIWRIEKTYAFPADDTSGDMKNRLWKLSGSDYNIILDKRVLRNPAHYTKLIYVPGGTSYSVAVIAPITDGEVIRGGPPRDGLNLGGIARFFDLSGFITDDEDLILDNYTFQKGYPFLTQGSKLRATMEDLAQAGTTADSGIQSVFWVDGNKAFHFIPQQELAVEWGFSDRPNWSTTFGFREATADENAMSIVNDGLVWGGSQWAKHGDIVFAREQDIASINLHGRWQAADVGVGNAEYNSQGQVDAKAHSMIFGPPGTTVGKNRGLTLPEQTFQASWFAARVPGLLVPGQVVPITLDVFEDEAVEMPLRSLVISWPGLNKDGSRAFTRFDGKFGLLQSDPGWLWRYLQKLRPGKVIKQVVATAKNDTSKPPYGAIYQDQPATQSIIDEEIVVTLDVPDGSKTLFRIPFMYVGNTMKLFINGIAQYRGLDYAETDPHLGTFTIFDPPGPADKLYVWASVAGAIST